MANEVERLVREFTSKLESVIRAQVVAEIDAVVRSAVHGVAGARSVGRTAARGALKVTAARSDGKRTPEEIEKIAAKLLAYIGAHPGQRSEQIADATGLATKELSLPIRRLLEDKKIKAAGKARGTTYTAK